MPRYRSTCVFRTLQDINDFWLPVFKTVWPYFICLIQLSIVLVIQNTNASSLRERLTLMLVRLFTLMRIRIRLFTLMRIRIRIFTLMRIRIRLFTLMRSRLWLFTLTWIRTRSSDVDLYGNAGLDSQKWMRKYYFSQTSYGSRATGCAQGTFWSFFCTWFSDIFICITAARVSPV